MIIMILILIAQKNANNIQKYDNDSNNNSKTNNKNY